MSKAPIRGHDRPTRAERRGAEAARSAHGAAAPKKRRGSRFIPLLIVLAGVLVVLYPVVATQYNNFKQHEFAVTYNSEVNEISGEDLAAGLAAARAYNESITGIPILDPYLDEVQQPESEEYARYLDELAATDVMARVRVPSVGIDLPVRHGTSEASIRNGAGHLYGTSLPVGGIGTHAVLTSHTGMSNATLFDHLIDVDEGDLIVIDVYGETLAYTVDQIKVVLPEEIGDLVPVAGHDYITLFTCTPYAVNSHRLLVRAERTEWTPEVEAASEASDSWVPQLEWWMWVLLGIALLGIAGLLTGALVSRRTKGPEDEAEAGAMAADGSTPLVLLAPSERPTPPATGPRHRGMKRTRRSGRGRH